jgi:5S rRNA maturation endonuclease (ribonuclease M5)
MTLLVDRPTENATSALEVLLATGWQYKLADNPKRRYTGPCPIGQHENDRHHPTFSIHEDKQRFRCFKCDMAGHGPKSMQKWLGDTPFPVPTPPRTATKPKPVKASKGKPRPKGCTLEQLAKAKGLDIELLKSLGWRDSMYPNSHIKSVFIPYQDMEGKTLANRYRVNIRGNPKYWWGKDTETHGIHKTHPYGLPYLNEHYAPRQTGNVDEPLLIVEGETDWAALRMMGIAALGIPGAQTWQESWNGYVFKSRHKEIIVWQEPGAAGEAMVKRIAKHIPGIKVAKLSEEWEWFKDANTILKLPNRFGPQEARQFVLDTLKEAKPYQRPSPKYNPDPLELEVEDVADLYDFIEQSQDRARPDEEIPPAPAPEAKPHVIIPTCYSNADTQKPPLSWNRLDDWKDRLAKVDKWCAAQKRPRSQVIYTKEMRRLARQLHVGEWIDRRRGAWPDKGDDEFYPINLGKVTKYKQVNKFG